MKRHNIEVILGWLDALRRRDLKAVGAALDDDIVWQGLREDLVCHGREEVVQGFIRQRDEDYEIDSLELIGAPEHVVLGVRVPDLRDVAGVEVQGEFYNLFALSAGRVVRIDDYRHRDDALAAAGLTKEPHKRGETS
jgi:hypothetical protein